MNDYEKETRDGLYMSLAMMIMWAIGIIVGINIGIDCF
jgi:hypothetical protein